MRVLDFMRIRKPFWGLRLSDKKSVMILQTCRLFADDKVRARMLHMPGEVPARTSIDEEESSRKINHNTAEVCCVPLLRCRLAYRGFDYPRTCNARALESMPKACNLRAFDARPPSASMRSTARRLLPHPLPPQRAQSGQLRLKSVSAFRLFVCQPYADAKEDRADDKKSNPLAPSAHVRCFA